MQTQNDLVQTSMSVTLYVAYTLENESDAVIVLAGDKFLVSI